MAGLQGWFTMKHVPGVVSRRGALRWSTAMALGLSLALMSVRSFAGTYENLEYGFSVEVPSDTARCMHLSSGIHPTGVIIILDASDIECDHVRGHPSIGIAGSYNSSFDTDVVSGLQGLCGDGNGGLTAAPPGLAFKHSRSAACRVPRDGDWITLYVASLAWSRSDPGTDPEWQTPWIEYDAWLHTTAERFEADTERFRAILNTVRIFTPE